MQEAARWSQVDSGGLRSVSSAQIELPVGLLALALLEVPFLARLLFRTRLIRIRDETIDAILNKRLRHTASVDDFIDTIAHWTADLRLVGLLYNGLNALTYCRHRISRASLPLFPNDLTELTPAERELMRDLGTRASHAHQSYMIAASPIGWIITPVILLVQFFTPTRRPAHARGRAADAKLASNAAPCEWPGQTMSDDPQSEQVHLV
jgi:hypothetical protein